MSEPDMRKTMKMIGLAAARFADGSFVTPERTGIVYMLSHYNRNINQDGSTQWFPPHLMFLAPNLANQDIGVSRESFSEDIHYPFVAYQGPHGFMISRLEPAARPEDFPVPMCPDWVRQ